MTCSVAEAVSLLNADEHEHEDATAEHRLLSRHGWNVFSCMLLHMACIHAPKYGFW